MDRIIKILLLVIISVSGYSQKFFFIGKSFTPNQYFTNVNTSQSGDVISVTFNYAMDGIFEPPSVYNVTTSGTTTDGQTLTASYEGYYSPNGFSDASTVQWYRADNRQSDGAAISGATSLTYNLVQADVAKYLRAVVTPIDSDGNTGTPVTSVYTAQIADDAFNPLTDLTWFTAHVPDGYTSGSWRNDGTLGGSASIQNGSDNVPTYNAGGGDPFVDFEKDNNEELVLDQPTPQFTMPVEIWIRFKLESYNTSWSYFADWNGTQKIEERNGPMYISGGNCSFTPSLNTWYVARIVISGSSNTSIFTVNNGTPKTDVAASTVAFGTSNGRLGSNAAGTSNRADVGISHFFVRQGTLNSTEISNMWAYFGL